MKEPKWIKYNVVEFIHHTLIKEFGGLKGIRDKNLLHVSLAAPKQIYHYLNPKPTIPQLASHYAFKLTKNHPFFDGNKRTAWMIALIFLEDNGFEILASNEEAYLMIIDLSSGALSEFEFLDWIENNIKKK